MRLFRKYKKAHYKNNLSLQYQSSIDVNKVNKINYKSDNAIEEKKLNKNENEHNNFSGNLIDNLRKKNQNKKIYQNKPNDVNNNQKSPQITKPKNKTMLIKDDNSLKVSSKKNSKKESKINNDALDFLDGNLIFQIL